MRFVSLRWLATLWSLVALAGCGQKGDLYYPEEPQSALVRSAPAQRFAV
jgi:predicted small lipoprotein YifL